MRPISIGKIISKRNFYCETMRKKNLPRSLKSFLLRTAVSTIQLTPNPKKVLILNWHTPHIKTQHLVKEAILKYCTVILEHPSPLLSKSWTTRTGQITKSWSRKHPENSWAFSWGGEVNQHWRLSFGNVYHYKQKKRIWSEWWMMEISTSPPLSLLCPLF